MAGIGLGFEDLIGDLAHTQFFDRFSYFFRILIVIRIL
jgi:hypothetical protein